MAKKILNILVTYNYEIEIDDNSPIVKEYENTKELVEHLAAYRFSILPVIDDGVEIMDVTVEEIEIKNN